MDVFLTTGVTLGLSAGFSPGPLTTLVISHSLQHGSKEGLKVALAPFITDVPIVVISVLLLAQLRESQVAFGLISLMGAAVLFYFSYLTFKAERVQVGVPAPEARSVAKGVLVNFLSPNPYVFWLTVGAPQMVEAWTTGPLTAARFIVGFYVCLVGSKMLLAFLAARSKEMLSGAPYRYVMRILGVALLILAFRLLKDGLAFLNVVRL